MNRASFFVPLSNVTARNGAMTYFLGTHNFGYLGDAGEILDDILPADWPSVTPELSPGDLVVMDSALWHESGPHTDGEDRVLVDIHVQPASDPTSGEIPAPWRPGRRVQDPAFPPRQALQTQPRNPPG